MSLLSQVLEEHFDGVWAASIPRPDKDDSVLFELGQQALRADLDELRMDVVVEVRSTVWALLRRCEVDLLPATPDLVPEPHQTIPSPMRMDSRRSSARWMKCFTICSFLSENTRSY